MNSVLLEASELLRRFTASEWREMYLRTPGYSLFLAKPGGGANPMTGSPAEPAPGADSYTLAAPHVATVRSIAQVGESCEAGSTAAQLEVLGDLIDIRSERSGAVQEVLARPGDLVQYQSPLLRIVPAPSAGGHGAPDE